MTLESLVIRSARRTPDAIAVRGPDETLTYGQLDERANRLGRALVGLGVKRGDRVGLWLDKSAAAVVAMQAVLRLGAAYVPLDPLNPPARVATIVGDCQMAVVVTSAARLEALKGRVGDSVRFLVVDGAPLETSAEPLPPSGSALDDLAYILYTSGSTGVPKGVCISHTNALAFIEWAAELARVVPEDRFGNHAPFHFDLSVLDLYVAFLGGASVSLIPDGLAYAPRRLVEFALREGLTIWYSVPSALILMMEQGKLLEEPSVPLRIIFFAGEPFPLKHLRTLRAGLPKVRLLNLYGPTETNVCTFHEVTHIPEDRVEPVPIGRASCGDRVWLAPVAEASGEEAPAGAQSGEVGELMVEGPTVMLGYWGKEPQGGRPYATGDICRRLPDGTYEYLGRRDQMVKVRGRRIELGEIEAALLAHPQLQEVAVVVSGSGMAAQLVAYVVSNGPETPALLELKRHCSERLPRYMIVDQVHALPVLPRTRNGKVDRRTLQAQAEASRAEPAPKQDRVG
ncbi:MAG TPA: amino acid adenylation domain-containing protein [Myxococcaceae bacterium]|nr:amino acid adenylation domain-containing protein [Myxococcaceae bacterium]